MPMLVRLRDTRTGDERPLRPSPGPSVAMYVCGPTVYASAHVGHGRTYLFFDLLRRFLEEEGVNVRHVMNITDFEDKVTVRAVALGRSWRALAREEERAALREFGRLGLKPPHVTPRASAHVPAMVSVVRRLERRGWLQWEDDSLVFHPPEAAVRGNFPLGRELERHAVPEPDGPDSGLDGRFVAWKRQGAPYANWPSPWGRGAPGWHLECYALARRYLGLPVQLHGGGVDLVYPHHYAENELSLVLDGTRFAQRFLHTAFVTQAGEKMSKSTGRLVALREALDSYGVGGLRAYLMSRPYDQRLDWRPAEARQFRESAQALRERCQASVPSGAGGTMELPALRRVVGDVRRAIAGGFHTDRAWTLLRDWSERLGRDPTGRLGRGDRRAALTEYRRLERYLGLPLL